MLVTSQVGKQNEFVLSNLSTLPLQERAKSLQKLKRSTLWQSWRESVSSDPHFSFVVGDLGPVDLLNRLRRKHGTLAAVLRDGIQRGVSPDVAAANVVSKLDAKSAKLEVELLRSSVSGPQIKRYHEWKPDQFIIYTTKATRIRHSGNLPAMPGRLPEFDSSGSRLRIHVVNRSRLTTGDSRNERI